MLSNVKSSALLLWFTVRLWILPKISNALNYFAFFAFFWWNPETTSVSESVCLFCSASFSLSKLILLAEPVLVDCFKNYLLITKLIVRLCCFELDLAFSSSRLILSKWAICIVVMPVLAFSKQTNPYLCNLPRILFSSFPCLAKVSIKLLWDHLSCESYSKT